MKISELKKELDNAIELYGDVDVYVWADHGQDTAPAYAVTAGRYEGSEEWYTVEEDEELVVNGVEISG